MNTCVTIEPLEPRRLLTTYYVNAAAGDDLRTGRSPILAWQSLTPVNTHTFKRGDKVLLTGTFTGQSLVLGPAATGVTVTSYTVNPLNHRVKTGVAGAAVLDEVPEDGIDISTSGVSISDVIAIAAPTSASVGAYYDGVHLQNSGTVPLTHITINNVAASGFAYAGLCMQGWNTSVTDSAGFSNVLIENSSFHDNLVSGIFVGTGDATGNEFQAGFPAGFYVNSNLTIKNCQAYNNAGYNPVFDDGTATANDGNSTSGGIFISSVNGAIVENCTAYNNCFAANGSVGIWAFDATRVNFLEDESYDNKTIGSADGDGFDFDHGVTDSIMQRDYSHGNDGAGYLITTYGGTSNNTGDTLRFSISDDDGQSNGAAGIGIFSVVNVPVLNANIYNNTILSGSGTSGSAATAIAITGDSADGDTLNILSNIFYSSTTGSLAVDTDPSTTVRLEGNDYWLAGAAGAVSVTWDATTYTSLSDWATATGEETATDAIVGHNQDPLLVSEDVSDLPIASVGNLALSATSPLRKEGLNLSSKLWAGAAPYNADVPYNLAGKAWSGLGGRNFFNRPINRLAIGAG